MTMSKKEEHDPLTEEEIEELHQETGIAPKTVRMIDKGMEEVKKGNTSGPIDMEEHFPGLFDDDE